MTKSAKYFLSAALILCLLQSCAPLNQSGFTEAGSSRTGANPRQVKFADKHLDLIVTDLVTAMVQVYELVPLTTTLQVSEPRGTYGRKLVAALEKAGYGIQRVSADQGDFYLSYQNRTIQSDSRDVRDFTVRVGDIEIHREYDIVGGRVIPVSVVYVSGSSSYSDMVLNTNLFLQQGGKFEFVSGAEFRLSDASVKATPIEKVNHSGSEDTDSFAENSSATRSIMSARDLDPPLRRATLIFENDALTIGRRNKEIIRSLLNEFNSAEDALFVSACPYGDEPQEHADEHVTRLKEELILNNVPASRIAEEGCVLSEYPQGKPTEEHTVIVTQRRLVGNLDAMDNTPSTQELFPDRPLALTVPHNVGSTTDFQARLVTMMAAQEDVLGQSILTINKPGSGGKEGWTWFAEAATDSGYDLATYNIPDFIAQSIKHSTQYNIDSLEPIANWGADPVVLVVPRDSRFRNVKNFLSFAKANAGQLSVSGGGEFVSHHIALMQLEKAASLKLDYQPDDNSDQAIQSVIEGSVLAGFTDMSDAIRHLDELRILAIADLKRNPAISSVPTFAELGVDVDDTSVNYRGLMVPVGTPTKVIETLADAALRMFDHPRVLQTMNEAGAPLKVMTREETKLFWQEKQKTLDRFFSN